MKPVVNRLAKPMNPDESNANRAREAVVARLAQLARKPVRPPKSMQPTPEAAKGKIARLRRKQRILQKTRRSSGL